MDLSPISRYLTLNVITRLMYGEAFGHLAKDADVYGFVEQVDIALKLLGVTLDVPLMRSIFLSNTFLRYFGPKPTDKVGIGKVMGWVTSLYLLELSMAYSVPANQHQ